MGAHPAPGRTDRASEAEIQGLRIARDLDPFPNWLTDLGGHYTFVNRPFEERFLEPSRQTHRDIIGKSHADIWPEEFCRTLKTIDAAARKRPDGTARANTTLDIPGLNDELVTIIANQPKVGPFVFTYVCQKSREAFIDANGRKHPARLKDERYPFTQWGWRRPWGKALKDAEISAFRFHDLRHTRGTRILRTTGNLVLAKEARKHRNIKTTLRYAHAADEDVRRALDASESRNIPEVRRRDVQ